MLESSNPFAGSSTTGVVALSLGRRYVGIEQDPHNIELSRLRLDTEVEGQEYENTPGTDETDDTEVGTP